MPAKAKKTVHGDDLLYRFFRLLLDEQPESALLTLLLMYRTMGVWFPIEVYSRSPILLPWVVRDPKCRGNKKKGLPDEWGAPDEYGFMRDDNSMIKAIPRSLSVKSSGLAQFSGAYLGSDFTAAHIWRVNKSDQLASRHPLLNSFVPNLVWLPTQIAKLTDHETSVMQAVLQEMSWRLYRDASVNPELVSVVDDAWGLLERPIVEKFDLEVLALNFFVVSEKFFDTRQSRIRSVVHALGRLNDGQSLESKVVSSRYTQGLPEVAIHERTKLMTFLQGFLSD